MSSVTSRPTQIPCISLWQPWASAWLRPDLKVHETRHWRVPERFLGKRVRVHAAKHKPTRDELEMLDDTDLRPEGLVFGAFIGSIVIAGCHPMFLMGAAHRQPAHSNDAWWGHWAPGRYAWEGADPIIFAEPIEARGQQGFWLAEPPSDGSSPQTDPLP